MKNWRILNNIECKMIWEFIYTELSFNPIDRARPLIKLPFPNKSYDLSNLYNKEFDNTFFNKLEEKAIDLFLNIAKNERIYALSWQHDCYSFNPNLPFEKDEFEDWIVPIFPNGEYAFFITRDFKNGIFGDGVNMSMAFFGNDFVNFAFPLNA